MVKVYISDSEWVFANNKFVENLKEEILKVAKNYESLYKITKYNTR